MSSANPNQWVDWGDETTTIDPMRNKHWVDSYRPKHAMDEDKSRARDTAHVERLASWHVPRDAPQHLFKPTSRMLQDIGSWHVQPSRGPYRGVRREEPSAPTLLNFTRTFPTHSDKHKVHIQKEIRDARHDKGIHWHNRGRTADGRLMPGAMEAAVEKRNLYEVPRMEQFLHEQNSRFSQP